MGKDSVGNEKRPEVDRSDRHRMNDHSFFVKRKGVSFRDTLFHSCGADRLAASVPQPCVRYDGEECAVLLPQASSEKARTATMRIVEGFHRFEGLHRPITAGFGVAGRNEG